MQKPALIDTLHRSLTLCKKEKRSELVHFLAERAMLEKGLFCHLALAFFEVLPQDTEDWKLANALLTGRPKLLVAGQRAACQDNQSRLIHGRHGDLYARK